MFFRFLAMFFLILIHSEKVWSCYQDYGTYFTSCPNSGPGRVVEFLDCTSIYPDSPYDQQQRIGCTLESDSLYYKCVTSLGLSAFSVCPGGPNPLPPKTNTTPNSTANACGSVIRTDTQVLSESISITGVPFPIIYSSDKVPGRKTWYQVKVPLTSTNFSNASSIVSETLEVQIAGQTFTTTVPASAALTYDYTWNGKDQNAQTVSGPQVATIKISENYNFTPEYPGQPLTSTVILGSKLAEGIGMGGWDFSVHHNYDSVRKTLYLGDGSAFYTNASTRTNGNYWIVSSDRSEVFVFDSTYKHIQTLNSLNGTAILTFSYDTSNRLTSIVDIHGNTTSIQYTGSVLTSITSPYGQVTQIIVDSNGYIATVTNPASEIYEITYTSLGLLLTFEKPSGVTSTMTYDSSGRLLSDSSEAGSETGLSVAYQENGYTVTEASALGRTNTHQVQISGDTYTRVDNNANQSVINNSESKSGSTQRSFSNYSYSSSSQSDPRFGSLFKAPLSVSITDGSQSASWSYSETPNLSDSSDPFSIQTMISTWAKDNKAFQSSYTASTKTLVETSPEGINRTSILDSFGNIISSQFASFTPATYDFDTNGRLLEIAQGTNRITTLSYHTSNGLLATIENSLGQSTEFTYDLAGRVLSQTLPDGREISYSYDSNGNLASVTPPGRPIHTMNHNDFDLISSYVTPDTTTTTYSYSNDRELTQVTRPNGQTIGMNYNSTTGNLTSIDLPTGTRNFYYSSGLLSASASEDSFGRAFSIVGTLLSYDSVYGGALSYNTAYNYNSSYLLAQENLTVGVNTAFISFTRDDDGLILSAGDQTYTRSSTTGFLASMTLANLSQTFSYSSTFGELSSITAVYNTTDIYQESFTRDNLGRIVTRTEKYGTSASKVYDHIYDSVGRLNQVKLGGLIKSEYLYDSNSNRVLQVKDDSGTTGDDDSYGLSLGALHTCAITPTGVKCWGYGTSGLLGYGNTISYGDNETLTNLASVSIGGVAQAITLGSVHTCVILLDGEVRCWGVNQHGQLGIGSTNSIGDNEVPSSQSVVSLGGPVKLIEAGEFHTCAVKINDKVVCWGLGTLGQLGYGNTLTIGDDELPSSAGEVDLGTTGEIIQIVVGLYHNCVLTSSGLVKCWGRNNYLQIGLATYQQSIGDNETPALTPFLDFGEAVTQIAGSGEHTCVLLLSKKIKCWGRNDKGQLGLGNVTSPTALSSTLGYVNIGEDVKFVGVGKTTTCVITVTDKIKCWGANESGQLGLSHTNTIGDNELPSTTSSLTFASTPISLNIGSAHVCASFDDGNMECWGSGLYGKLGYGTTDHIGDTENPIGFVSGISTGGIISYDDQDRLLRFGTRTFTYNLNGDLTQEVNSAPSITKNFTYDVMGNLKQVVLPSKTINYGVDAFNRRIVKKSGATVENFFVWNKDNQLIGIANSSNSLTSRFVYGSKKHVPDYMIQGTNKFQIVTNHLGSPVAVVNADTGTVAQQITYDEFGMVLSDTSPGFTPFGYAGCLYDVDTKLCRFGARDYDASIGRWLSKDPILFNGGDTNLYGYVFQDPINFIDTNGEFAFALIPFLPYIPGIITGAKLAASGIAAWYAGQLLGDAYNKRNSDKPQSKQDPTKLGDPLGHNPRGPGDWALIGALGVGLGKLANSCGSNE